MSTEQASSPQVHGWRTRLLGRPSNRIAAEGMSAQKRHSISSSVDIPIQLYSTTNSVSDSHDEVHMPQVSSEPVIADRLKPPPTVPGSVRSSRSQVFPIVKNKVNSLFHVWDNRFALKIFGSRNGIMREEERRKNSKHWIIHPCSKFR